MGIIRLSFIIPLYNAEPYIVTCLERILACDLPEEEYEVIVWNDGSKDSGADVVAQLSLRHSCVRLFSDENHGVSYARNRALSMAQGEYVWFVDADDMVVSQQILPILTKAEQSRADMLTFRWQAFDGYNYSPGLYPVNDMDTPVSGKSLFCQQRLMMSPWCYLYRRAFLSEHNLTFPENYNTCEDIQFNQKAFYWAQRVVATASVAYTYRLQASSASQGKKQTQKVLKDQLRRVWPELCYFLPLGAWRYSARVVWLNLREIAFWNLKLIRALGHS